MNEEYRKKNYALLILTLFFPLINYHLFHNRFRKIFYEM